MNYYTYFYMLDTPIYLKKTALGSTKENMPERNVLQLKCMKKVCMILFGTSFLQSRKSILGGSLRKLHNSVVRKIKWGTNSFFIEVLISSTQNNLN